MPILLRVLEVAFLNNTLIVIRTFSILLFCNSDVLIVYIVLKILLLLFGFFFTCPQFSDDLGNIVSP